jgi:hypothetical protein
MVPETISIHVTVPMPDLAWSSRTREEWSDEVEADGNVRASIGKLEITGIRGSSACRGAWFVRRLHSCAAPQIVGGPKAFEGGQSRLGKA